LHLGSLHCLELAVRRHAFGRAFKAPVATGAEERLREALIRAWEKPTPDVRG
jgi:hypothetical protein